MLPRRFGALAGPREGQSPPIITKGDGTSFSVLASLRTAA